MVIFKGLESHSDEPIVVHEHQYATDLTDGKVKARSEGEINTAEKCQTSTQKLFHVSDESTTSEVRPGIKVKAQHETADNQDHFYFISLRLVSNRMASVDSRE